MQNSVSKAPDQIEPILADSKKFFVISNGKLKNFINSSFIDQFSNFFHLDRWKINFRNTQFHFSGVPTLQTQGNVQN